MHERYPGEDLVGGIDTAKILAGDVHEHGQACVCELCDVEVAADTFDLPSGTEKDVDSDDADDGRTPKDIKRLYALSRFIDGICQFIG